MRSSPASLKSEAGMRLVRLIHLACTLAVILSIAGHARAQCGPQWLPGDGIAGVNGDVSALMSWDRDGPGPEAARVVAAGRFTIAGAAVVSNIAAWDGSSWAALGLGVNEKVHALAILSNGDLVAGGAFTTAGGAPANYIARWDGVAWSPLGSGMDNSVSALAVMPNGDLIAGGGFTSAGGVAANFLGRWNGIVWSNLETETNGPVHALAVRPNGDLIAAGGFTIAGGTPANDIARWDGMVWSAMGSGMTHPYHDGNVSSLSVLPNGDVVAGGNFLSADGKPAGCIARWNGTDWLPLGAGLKDPDPGHYNGYVSSLAVLPNGDVIAGGWFTTADGKGANDIARWDGTDWSRLGSWTRGPVTALAVMPDGDLIVGGGFMSAGGVLVNNIARWDGTAWSRLGAGFNSAQFALAVLPDGDLVAGGNFAAAGNVAASAIARWDGTAWTPLGSGMNSTVSALAVLPNGDLVAGGAFGTAGGVAANNIARWNGTTWSALGSGMNGSVAALAVLPNGDLVAGGDFTTAGGVAANRIARWNGTAWSPLGSGMEGAASGGPANVCALAALPNGDLVAGGHFVKAGGIVVNRIARWNGTAWSGFGSGMTGNWDNAVCALAVLPNGDLVAGGYFVTAGGLSARSMARWNGSAWSSFGSGLSDNGNYGRSYSLAVLPNGDLLAGGRFDNAGGVPANSIARWNGTAWSALGSGFGGYIPIAYALALLPNGDLVAGGNFSTAGENVSVCWARWTENPTPWVALQPQPQTVCSKSTLTITATPANGYSAVSYQWQRNGTDIANGPGGASTGGGTVSGASGTLPSPTSGTPAALTITTPQPSDSGDYTVVFTNPCGSVTSAPASITVCIADYNCDGFVDGIDYDRFSNDFESGDPAADVNGDGSINATDYSAFIHGFEIGC